MGLGRKIAFTLVELLVVISIIALLISILLPSLGKAREQGRRAKCMANLRSMGQAIHIYANDHKDILVPGDFWCGWDVWAWVSEYAQTGIPQTVDYRQVNLGHLLADNALPLPDSEDHVFFCPSMNFTANRAPDGTRSFGYEQFSTAWGNLNRDPEEIRAPIAYLFNNALDGFSRDVQQGLWPILSHQDKIHFLRGDGSVGGLQLRPELFDPAFGPELLQKVASRHEDCFPTYMIHKWLEEGKINLEEAQDYLASPKTWFMTNGTDSQDQVKVQGYGRIASRVVRLDKVMKNSLVCDVVGAWGGEFNPDITPPPGSG